MAADPIAILQALIRCQSVTPADDGALDVIQSLLEPAGFVVHRMTFSEPGTADVANLYARLGESQPNFCFAGHTDVVPPGDLTKWTHPPFDAVIDGDQLFGRGAVDMKGAIACFLAAALDHTGANGGAPKRGSISLLITGDEEGPSINGTTKVLEWLAQRGETINACVVGEPTNPIALGDEIKTGRRGSLNCELVVKGRQGHAAYPDKADNPVPKLAAVVDALSRHEPDAGTEHFARTNIEVCVISCSSSATNVIPDEALARFNVRYNDTWVRSTIEAHIRDVALEAAMAVDAHIDLSFSGTGDVFLTAPGPFVDRVARAVQSVTGRKPKLTTGGGTSDARFIQAYCPVVEFGLVNATIHAIDERTTLADLTALTAIYRAMLDDDEEAPRDT
ncbi:MAG: succinyl-diaminopimelate desuccinylase [Pseudomonadota bacterium]